MSFARQCGGLPSGSLGDLGILGRRCLGCPSYSLRLPDSLRLFSISLPGSAPPPEILSHLHPGDCSCCCGGGPAGEGGHRTCLCLPRILQSSVCYSQGHWRVASSDRSLTPQSFCRRLSFSHGDCSVGAPVPPSGGLAYFLRSSKCLPAGSGSSSVSQVSEVLRGRFRLPVPHSLLRPCDGSAGLHPRHGPGLLHHASVWLQDPSLPGRLACPQILVPGGCTGEDFLLWLCQELGIRINLAKSSLSPARSIDYLGVRL